MPRDFFPRPNTEALCFTQSFSDLINADPALYGVPPERAAAYAEMQLAYAQACQATALFGSTTPAQRADRREKRRILERETRLLARLIRAQPTITPKALADIGLKRRRPPRRIGPPTTAPLVTVHSVIGQLITVNLIDTDGDKRRLPAGATHAIVLLYEDDGNFCPSNRRLGMPRLTSRTRVRLQLPPSAAGHTLVPGTRVWITAAWVNRRGQRGPWSNPVYTYLAGIATMLGSLRRAA